MPGRREARKKFVYYMRVLDHDLNKLMGYMADISEHGFRVESDDPIPVGELFHVRLDLTGDLGTHKFMTFYAISKWCTVDPYDPSTYDVGFEMRSISEEYAPLFRLMYERYGAATTD